MIKSDKILIAILACAPNFVLAQGLNDPVAQTIVVSATKNQRSKSAVGATVKLIDESTILDLQALQISDALSQTTAISVARNGGYGQPTSIFIRGGESHDTQLIIDGIVMNEPSLPAGNFDFANSELNNVSRIEVLKGPQSVLYGADAIGGVIYVTTKLPTKSFEGNANIEFGEFNTKIGRFNIGAKSNGLLFSINAGTICTDGISAKAKKLGGFETDGYSNNSINGRISYDLGKTASIDLLANYSDARADFDGFPDPLYEFADTDEYSEIKRANLYLGINSLNFDKRLKSVFSAKSAQTDRRNFDPSLVPNITYIAKSDSQTLEYFGDFRLSENTAIVFGALNNEFSYSTKSPAPWDINPSPSRANADIKSIYSEIQFANKSGLSATFGARNDSHSSFGDKTTMRASLVYAQNANRQIHFNYGEGFKAPSLFQIYSDYGNPNIKPETANAIEIGVNQKVGSNWAFNLTAYDRKSENQIDYFSCFGSIAPLCVTRPFGFYDNVKKAKSEGIELEANYSNAAFSVDFGFAINNAKNTARDSLNFGRQLARRPRQSGNLMVSYRFNPKFKASIAYNYIGERYDDAANQNLLKPYNQIGLLANYSLNDNFEVYGRIENLANSQIEMVKNYGTMPRSANIGFRARF